jgi:hypothetical protein
MEDVTNVMTVATNTTTGVPPALAAPAKRAAAKRFDVQEQAKMMAVLLACPGGALGAGPHSSALAKLAGPAAHAATSTLLHSSTSYMYAHLALSPSQLNFI